ncbi:MAG TPA: TolC family protein [Longimicrobium sp.]|jgi:outer membrane protein TolC
MYEQSRATAPEEPSAAGPVRSAPSGVMGWVALVALAAAPGAAAQEPAGLSLQRAVEATLVQSPSIQVGRLRAEGASGARIAASAPFDTQLRLAADDSYQKEPTIGEGGIIPGAAVSAHRTAYTLGASRLLRSGIQVQPEVAVTRTADRSLTPVPSSAASVRLRFTMPLARDRWGSISAAPERTAEITHRSLREELRYVTAAGVLETVRAYWSYLAAQQELEVYRNSEERAERLTGEMEQLVKADERPASDLNQLQATAAIRRRNRIAAEQRVVEARRELGISIGVEGEAIHLLPPATTPFPAAAPWEPGPAEVDRLVERALAHRADLASRAHRVQAAGVLSAAARGSRRPRLDLSTTVGYNGLASAGDARGFVAPLYQHVPGPIATVALEYRLPVANAEAQGLFVQRRALEDEERVAAADLARRITSGVRASAEALRREAQGVAESSRAVELYRTAVDNEHTKYRLGAATLLDVILAEGGLNEARLGEVSARFRYAVAVATLRFETGSLAEMDREGRTVVPPGSLITPP